MSETLAEETTAPALPYVDVAVAGGGLGSLAEALTYAVPPAHDWVRRGSVVWLPLRGQIAIGVALERHDRAPEFATREILGGDAALALSELQLEAAAWLARETASTLATCAALFLPPGVNERAYEMLTAAPERTWSGSLTPVQRETLRTLTALGEASPDALRKATGRSLTTTLPALLAAGAITRRVVADGLEPPPPTVLVARVMGGGAAAKTDRQRALVAEIARRGAAAGGEGWVEVAAALRAAEVERAVLEQATRRGLVETATILRSDLPQASAPVGETPPPLTPEQAAVWAELEAALVERDATPVLLRGVTGSGKTELYLRAAAWCLAHGRGVVILAPEIALASQLVRRVAARFPDETVVLHSALTAKQRLEAWGAVRRGEKRIVVGPRSAIFAPLAEPGLIVLDEEHEPSCKQESDPRYHARWFAEYLARRHRALLVLGSATPAVETAARAQAGEIAEYRLGRRVRPSRTEDATDGDYLSLPTVEIVDLRLELHRGNASLFSRRLQEGVRETIARGEQVVLFLNRRGMATVVLCGDCGEAVHCPYCDIPHVWHQDRRRLLCHRCGYQTVVPPRCPSCSGALQFLGAGTQRVADQAEATFGGARVLRWDQDSMRQRGAMEAALARIEAREVDLIVGTQMIAKGLDLAGVTLVGVIQADTLLQLPDFRSAERTFQLLTQVAGRAGRRGEGRVIVQTYQPAHYAIQAAARHDVDAFYAEEIPFRRIHRYPPYTRLVRYLVRRPDEERAEVEAIGVARLLARHAAERGVEIDLLGPAPAFAAKIAGEYQWQLVLRASADGMEALLDGLPTPPGWVVDVDPMSVL
jgi:primosomal protein N' (replication factor Y)